MDSIIKLEHLTKEFKVLNKREGLKGNLLDLFSKNYSTLTAVNDITLDVKPGEMVGFLGPNGAGKSTTIKIMTGVLEPTRGNITVNGRAPYKNRTKTAEDIGVVFGQRTQLWWALPAIESFRILKDIYRIDDKTYRNNLEYFDKLVGASELYHKTVRQMSLGQRTLCDILASFLHNPSVVFLDEPTIGLDVSMKSKIRELIKALNREKNTTVILTTHDMGDVDALCSRIVIIDKGTMLYDNNIEKLRVVFGAYRTVKVMFGENQNEDFEKTALEMESYLKNEFPNVTSLSVSLDDKWIAILINEDEVAMMEIINCIQKKRKIADMLLQEISTESVIKKVYEGGL
jgi:ABC-2 type transport system ATP-binding protein